MDGNVQTDAGSGRSARAQARDAAALAIARGWKIKDAAAEAKIGERTLYKWLKKPAFKSRVAQLRSQMIEEACGVLARFMGTAASVMASLLTNPDPAMKYKAARSVLEIGIRIRDAAEFAERLDALEARIGTKK